MNATPSRHFDIAMLDNADAPERRAGAVTGLPVPRFVSLKSDRANVRRGPGTDYPIDWVYRKRGIPLEVIAESNNWRRIRDHEGDGGWVLHTMLGGERSATVEDARDNALWPIRSAPRAESEIVAYSEGGVTGRISTCRDGWCRFSASGQEGWIEGRALWGVYPGEEFD